jgi:hypothetical protein
MANKTANMSMNLSYVGPLGQSTQLSPPVTVATPYNGLVEGTWDLAPVTMTGSVFTVPLGGITNPTGYMVKNNSDCDVSVKHNTAGAYTLSPGATAAMFSPATVAGTTPITELKLTTQTDTILAGSVGFIVFGDPT